MISQSFLLDVSIQVWHVLQVRRSELGVATNMNDRVVLPFPRPESRLYFWLSGQFQQGPTDCVQSHFVTRKQDYTQVYSSTLSLLFASAFMFANSMKISLLPFPCKKTLPFLSFLQWR